MSLKSNTFYALSENYRTEGKAKPAPQKRKCKQCGPVEDNVEIVYDTKVDPVLGIRLGYDGWCKECIPEGHLEISSIKINDMFDKLLWR